MLLWHARQQVARGRGDHRTVGGDQELEASLAEVIGGVGDLAREEGPAGVRAEGDHRQLVAQRVVRSESDATDAATESALTSRPNTATNGDIFASS